ncbi:hypothetical protein GCM10010842_34970 [Deinococcus daejeonensis]|uniref:Uncharacterized protein n=1 Tax=Deinococcus daejeonensis TaxID=1007098 RepID=A0ABQ2JHD8_9DEIO|nr:hypothetical protein GCM10010842_34970 [Deinococcus daejeonensis]
MVQAQIRVPGAGAHAQQPRGLGAVALPGAADALLPLPAVRDVEQQRQGRQVREVLVGPVDQPDVVGFLVPGLLGAAGAEAVGAAVLTVLAT